MYLVCLLLTIAQVVVEVQIRVSLLYSNVFLIKDTYITNEESKVL